MKGVKIKKGTTGQNENGSKLKVFKMESGNNEKMVTIQNDQNEKWSKLKVVKMKGIDKWSQWKWSQWKVVKMESGQNGKLSKWKLVKTESGQN